jgi:2'-5' RNA ligase superfamily
MRRLSVVIYPIISAHDFEWIQSIRKQYDELNFNVIAPHFTLIFPVANIAEATFIHHVKQSTKNIRSFNFALRCATICDDAFCNHTHVFLVPDEGHSQIIKLHDRLYTGVLAKELRLDLAFIPHIGIANSRNISICKQLADRLNQQNFEVCGAVRQLDIIWDENDRAGTIEKIFLI